MFHTEITTPQEKYAAAQLLQAQRLAKINKLIEAERQIIPARSPRHAAEMDRQLQRLHRDTIRWKREIFARVFNK